MTLISDSEAGESAVELVSGGWFTFESRTAAVRYCAPLLNQFFSADSATLVDSEIFGKPSAAINGEEFYGLEFRVAIAAARRLIGIVSVVAQKCSFKYGLKKSEQHGYLSARVDLPRWARSRAHAGDGPPVYPVHVVSRFGVTPENVLVYWALRWMRIELSKLAIKSGALASSTERKYAEQLDVRLRRLQSMHPLTDCRAELGGIRNQVHIEGLISASRRRVRRREIPNVEAYTEFLDWFSRSLRKGIALEPGEIEWSFYDHKFDRRLFELWCLSSIKDALVRDLSVDGVSLSSSWNNGGLAYEIRHFGGSVSIFFQRAIDSVDAGKSPRWIRETGRSLTGIPDIVLQVTSASRHSSTILVDPKLRQRSRLPSEEIHKMIGYLDNYELSPRTAILVLYAPDGDYRIDRLVDSRSTPPGQISVVRVDPRDPEGSSAGFREISMAVLNFLNLEPIPLVSVPYTGSDGSFDPESAAEERAAAAVQQLLQLGRSSQIDISGGLTFMEIVFGADSWACLSAELQTVLATAFVVGNSLQEGDDFSGPVLGMCSALENWLGIFCKEITGGSATFTMLGQLVALVDCAAWGSGFRKSAGSPEHLAAAYFASLLSNERGEEIKALIPGWRKMNRDLRRPSAHYGLVGKSLWKSALTDLVVNGTLSRSFKCLVAE